MQSVVVKSSQGLNRTLVDLPTFFVHKLHALSLGGICVLCIS